MCNTNRQTDRQRDKTDWHIHMPSWLKNERSYQVWELIAESFAKVMQWNTLYFFKVVLNFPSMRILQCVAKGLFPLLERKVLRKRRPYSYRSLQSYALSILGSTRLPVLIAPFSRPFPCLFPSLLYLNCIWNPPNKSIGFVNFTNHSSIWKTLYRRH